jgi:type IX secretion system substrate protein
MKRLLILIILIAMGSNAFAQDPELFDNDWYLEKVIIDGEEIIPPYLVVEPKVGRIYFQVDEVTYEFCDFRVCDVIYDSSENIFELGEWIAAGHGCDQPENFLFEPIYGSIFYDGTTPKNPFLYDFTINSEGVLVLTITNGEGNQAIYGNIFLSVPDASLSEIKIYPNPSSSVIFIESQKDPITKIELLNLLGESLESATDNTDSIDISDFASGIYLLRIFIGQESTVKKIVKK